MKNRESQLRELKITVPAWIDQDITAEQVYSIMQGGCASGAYMPAVTYHQASETMHKYGDTILDYIQDAIGELPKIPDDTSWGGIAVIYLSCAVELWAGTAECQLEEVLINEEM